MAVCEKCNTQFEPPKNVVVTTTRILCAPCTAQRAAEIGLANHAEDGVLPWTAGINMGFGDGDGGGIDPDEDHQVTARR